MLSNATDVLSEEKQPKSHARPAQYLIKTRRIGFLDQRKAFQGYRRVRKHMKPRYENRTPYTGNIYCMLRTGLFWTGDVRQSRYHM